MVFPTVLLGQQDTVRIPEVKIEAQKVRKDHVGGTTQQWTAKQITNLPSNNIADLLQQEAGIFVKSAGLGNLATSSIRGGSAGHTLVLWNGLPIQSPMLGLLDLSLLPVNSVEEITVEKGGNSALWGSGAIGGIVGLNHLPDFSNQIKIQTNISLGSFDFERQGIKLGLGNDNFQSVTKLSHFTTDNDYTYEIAPHLPLWIQKNAQLTRQNLLQDFYWKIKNKHFLSFHFWRQISQQHIPPTIVQNKSEAYQKDRSTRIILDWKRVGDQKVLQGKVGFFDEYNDYFDPATNLESSNHFKRWLAELESKWSFRNQQSIFVGVTQSYTKAWSPGYPNAPTENKFAIFTSYKIEKSNWQFQSSLRQELVNGKLIPIVPVLGFNYQLFDFLSLKTKVSKNYRLPTLNDRFWVPGGNNNLLAESGWGEEGSFLFNFQLQNLKCNYTVTGFNRTINNRIIWVPLEGQPFWSANNISKVWSRGLEQQFSIFYKKEKMQIQWDVGYDYIRSTNQIALELPKLEKGQQLIYIPIHQGYIKTKLNWNRMGLSYHHQFVGKSQGVNEDISSYHVGNIQLNFKSKKENGQQIFFLNLNNIWNASYFVIERRPNPTRHLQIGINLIFNKSKSQE